MTRIIRIARFIQRHHASLFIAAFGTLGYAFGLVLLLAHTTPIPFPASITHAAYGITVLCSPFSLLFALYIDIYVREKRRKSRPSASNVD